MRRYPVVFALLFGGLAYGQKNIATTPLFLPDSVEAIAFLSEITIGEEATKDGSAGISTDLVSLKMEKEGSEKSFEFEFPAEAKVMARGEKVEMDKGEFEWIHNWTAGETYDLLVQVATDSADNFVLYSGYIRLARENKWKLLGTCRIDGRRSFLKQPALFHTTGQGSLMVFRSENWTQRSNGSWRSFQENNAVPYRGFSNIDSAQREKEEIAIIEEAIRTGKTPARSGKDGVYYSILKEGNGRQVSIDDTVSVYYKGYLFSNEEVFDQTGETPARFPLKRLIRGWQIGVPLTRIGGKILLVIPSHLAYSIRTRASKIPPNSILVFEVEVLDAVAGK
jgi:FKBP-type peptidyl-prolyl cis-trans isomerase